MNPISLFRYFAFSTLSPFLLFAFLLASCNENTTVPDGDDHEFVTTVKIVVTDSITESIATYVWEDLDGPGGAAPNTVDTMRFIAGRAYTAEVFVLNNSITPPDDFTETIIVEGDVHQFFYGRMGIDLTPVYLDKDYGNKPLGQKVKFNAGVASSGALIIELSHYDQPSDKDGISRSDEADISVTLPVLIR